MEELQAKWVFDQGGFSKVLVVPTPMGAGYHLHLVKFGRQSETVVLERQRGGCGMKIKFHPIDGQMPPFRRHLVHIHEQSIILVSG